MGLEISSKMNATLRKKGDFVHFNANHVGLEYVDCDFDVEDNFYIKIVYSDIDYDDLNDYDNFDQTGSE